MSIQIGYGVSAYQYLASEKMDVKKAGANAAQPSALDTAQTTPSSNSVDRVTLSPAAQALAAGEKNATQSRTPAQERLLTSASSDRASAEKIAEDMAYGTRPIFYDLRESIASNRMDKINKLSSGRIVDDAFKQRITLEAANADAQRRAIYESEKLKGTDPLQIISKMMDFTNTQSKDYLEATAQAGPSIAQYPVV